MRQEKKTKEKENWVSEYIPTTTTLKQFKLTALQYVIQPATNWASMPHDVPKENLNTYAPVAVAETQPPDPLPHGALTLG